MILFLLASVSAKLLFVNEERQFVSWMRQNGFCFTGDEYHFRFGVFMANMRWVSEFNKNEKKTFRVKLNKFAAFTPSESNLLLGAKPTLEKPSSYDSSKKHRNINAPDSIDWRDKGYTIPIQNQILCGACWAFSAVCSSEAAYFMKTSQLLKFSEQNLVDCADTCHGCSGGWPYNAYNYVINKQNGQYMLSNDYPYTGNDDQCKFDASKGVGKLSSYISIAEGDEDELKENVASNGVASVCIDANNIQFLFYENGVFDIDGCSTSVLNHAVGVVGYGSTDDGIPYWIIRNSYGEGWGDDGYMLLVRNKNMCGVASAAVLAIP